jgi:hypothetical protein
MPQFVVLRKELVNLNNSETKEKYRIKCGTHHIQNVGIHCKPQKLNNDNNEKVTRNNINNGGIRKILRVENN